MATETKSSVVKVSNKPSGSVSHVGSSSKPKFDPSLNKKKLIGGGGGESAAGGGGGSSSSKPSFDSKRKITTTVTKTEVKKTTTKKTIVKKREKKVYSLPGQKSDPPEEREPLRIFYESLSKQIPSSEMAEFWMMEHGLLPLEKAKKAYDKKQRKQKQLRLGTPIKSPPPPPARPQPPSSRPQSSKPSQQVSKNGEMKAKKRVIESDDDDDDFVLSHKRRKG